MSTGHGWGWRLPKIQWVLALHIVGCSDSTDKQNFLNGIEPFSGQALQTISLNRNLQHDLLDGSYMFLLFHSLPFFWHTTREFLLSLWIFHLEGLWIWTAPRGQEWVWWRESQPSDVGRSTSSTFAWGRTWHKICHFVGSENAGNPKKCPRHGNFNGRMMLNRWVFGLCILFSENCCLPFLALEVVQACITNWRLVLWWSGLNLPESGTVGRTLIKK